MAPDGRLAPGRQSAEIRLSASGQVENVIHHQVRGLTPLGEPAEGGLQERPGFLATETGQDDQAGMETCPLDQSAEVAPVLRHDNTVLVDAASENRVVPRSPTADMEGMDRVEGASLVEAEG